MLKKNQKGFTIIELLVVIVIIGILVALALPNLFAAQARGRDSDRKNEIKNLQQRLETYFNDNGEYPQPNTAAMVSALGGNATDDEYVSPRNEAYVYTSDGSSFELYATLENDNDPDGETVDGEHRYIARSVNQ